jgi:hypothetical protein
MSNYHYLAYSREWLDSELATAVRLIRELAEDTPCRLDHEGYCQAHNLHPDPCPHHTAMAFLARQP